MKRAPLAFALLLATTGALLAQGAPAIARAPVTSIDALEAQMLTRLNALRLRRGLTLLRVSPGLSSAARYHTQDMARNGFCGHDSANGTPFFTRISRFYGRGRGWGTWSAAENVLCHHRRLTAAAALGEWLKSPGHRANLLAPHWRDVGLSALYADDAPGEFSGDGVLLITAAFGTR